MRGFKLIGGVLLAAGLIVGALTVAGQRSGGCDRGLVVPEGFCATVFADDVGAARHLVVAPSGTIYVATWGGQQGRSGVVALRDTNGDGRADLRQLFGAGGGSGIAIHDSMLYFATLTAVYRYRLSSRSLAPVAPPETVVSSLPQLGHAARSIALDDHGNLFLNIGVTSNACERDYEHHDLRGAFPCRELETSGGIWKFTADGRQQTADMAHRFATGLRHTVALAVSPIDGLLYGVPHGIDHLHTWWPAAGYSEEEAASIPSETLFRIDSGADYRFPYCMHDPRSNRMVIAPAYRELRDSLSDVCRSAPRPLATFEAHAAPMALAWDSGGRIAPEFRGATFVALHGSAFHAPLEPRGYAVVILQRRGDTWTTRNFATGPRFLGSFHPSGLAISNDGSLYISDDDNKRVWMIRRRPPR